MWNTSSVFNTNELWVILHQIDSFLTFVNRHAIHLVKLVNDTQLTFCAHRAFSSSSLSVSASDFSPGKDNIKGTSHVLGTCSLQHRSVYHSIYHPLNCYRQFLQFMSTRKQKVKLHIGQNNKWVHQEIRDCLNCFDMKCLAFWF